MNKGGNINSIGLSDNGAVAFGGDTAGNAPDGTALGNGVYTAHADGSHAAVIADEDHLFYLPGAPRARNQDCIQNFAYVSVGGSSVVFGGSVALFWSIYAQPVGSAPRGTTPVNEACELVGSAGPVVWNSRRPLPGDPSKHPLPASIVTQTDGTKVYFQGFDWNLGCCSTVNGQWDGLFAVPLAGGAVTKIVAGGDRLPAIGLVTDVVGEFSVDGGDVAFIASNESVSPPLRGIFLLHQGRSSKYSRAATGSTAVC
jgi:hypothetical protein